MNFTPEKEFEILKKKFIKMVKGFTPLRGKLKVYVRTTEPGTLYVGAQGRIYAMNFMTDTDPRKNIYFLQGGENEILLPDPALCWKTANVGRTVIFRRW